MGRAAHRGSRGGLARFRRAERPKPRPHTVPPEQDPEAYADPLPTSAHGIPAGLAWLDYGGGASEHGGGSEKVGGGSEKTGVDFSRDPPDFFSFYSYYSTGTRQGVGDRVRRPADTLRTNDLRSTQSDRTL